MWEQWLFSSSSFWKLEFRPSLRPTNASIFAKKAPVFLQKIARMKNSQNQIPNSNKTIESPCGRYIGWYHAAWLIFWFAFCNFLCGRYFSKPQSPPWSDDARFFHMMGSIRKFVGTAVYYYLRPPSVPFRLFRRQSLHNHSLQDHPLENPCTLIANQRSLDNKVSSGSSER